MTFLRHVFRWQMVVWVSCCLVMATVGLWIWSEFQRVSVVRNWRESATRLDARDPTLTILEDSSGGWELSCNRGSVQFEKTFQGRTYGIHARGVHVGTFPYAAKWNWEAMVVREEEWEQEKGFLGFKRSDLVARRRPIIFEAWTVLVAHQDHDDVWVIPFWAVVVLAGLPAGVGLLRMVLGKRAARARMARGLCRVCGYDLRGHGPGQRCPECGVQTPAREWRVARG